MPETQKMTLPVVDLSRKTDGSRKVLWTGDKTQLVLMAIPEGGEIGGEWHDQLLYFVAGTGVVKIGDVETTVADGDISIVPSGVFHNFRNIGASRLKLLTPYSPSEHTPGTEHAIKVEAGQ